MSNAATAKLTADQISRVQSSLTETLRLLVVIEKQRTFDSKQAAAKQERIRFYALHSIKLADMIAEVR